MGARDMTQHYQSNVVGILKFCPTCNRKTMHSVYNHRVGSCVEIHAAGMSKAQEKRAILEGKGKQQPLFAGLDL